MKDIKRVKDFNIGQKNKNIDESNEIDIEKSHVGLQNVNNATFYAKQEVRETDEHYTSRNNQEVEDTNDTTIEQQNFVIYLTYLLTLEWNPNKVIKVDIDLVKILTIIIYFANTINQSNIACASQLDIEEQETYAKTMQGPNISQWTYAITQNWINSLKTPSRS